MFANSKENKALLLALISPLSASTTRAACAASIALPSDVATFVPSCATGCLSSFVDANYAASDCGSTPSLQCLCARTGTNGFTLGEAALSCLAIEERDDNCTGTDVSASASVKAYEVCIGQTSAVPETHSTLMATVVVPQSRTTITRTYTVSPTSSLPSSSSLPTASSTPIVSSTASTAQEMSTSAVTTQQTSDAEETAAQSTSPSPTSTSAASSAQTKGASRGLILGISLGAAAFVAILLAAYLYFRRVRRKMDLGPIIESKEQEPGDSRKSRRNQRKITYHELDISLPLNLNPQTSRQRTEDKQTDTPPFRPFSPRKNPPSSGRSPATTLVDGPNIPLYPIVQQPQDAFTRPRNLTPPTLISKRVPEAGPQQAPNLIPPSAEFQPLKPPRQEEYRYASPAEVEYEEGNAYGKKLPPPPPPAIMQPNRDGRERESIITEFAEDGEVDSASDARLERRKTESRNYEPAFSRQPATEVDPPVVLGAPNSYRPEWYPDEQLPPAGTASRPVASPDIAPLFQNYSNNRLRPTARQDQRWQPDYGSAYDPTTQTLPLQYAPVFDGRAYGNYSNIERDRRRVQDSRPTRKQYTAYSPEAKLRDARDSLPSRQSGLFLNEQIQTASPRPVPPLKISKVAYNKPDTSQMMYEDDDDGELNGASDLAQKRLGSDRAARLKLVERDNRQAFNRNGAWNQV